MPQLRPGRYSRHKKDKQETDAILHRIGASISHSSGQYVIIKDNIKLFKSFDMREIRQWLSER